MLKKAKVKQSKVKQGAGSKPALTYQILSCFALLSIVVTLHATHVAWEVIVIFYILCIWRCLAIRWKYVPCNAWVIYPIAVIVFLFVASRYGIPVGRHAGIAYLLVLVGLKCMEIRTIRDIKITILLGFFVVITHFLFAESYQYIPILLAATLMLFWLLAQTEHIDPIRFWLFDLKLMGSMVLQSIPFVLLLFYLLPRLSGSIFLFKTEGDQAITGLSDTLQMGTVGQLAQSDEIAFIASFDSESTPPPDQRYWRGNVFWQTDGRTWSRGDTSKQISVGSVKFNHEISDKNPLYRYTIDSEISRQNWLFTLDYPVSLPNAVNIDSDYHLYTADTKKPLKRYHLASNPNNPAFGINPFDPTEGLSLGNTIVTPRLQSLVEQFNRNANDASELANNILTHFATQPFNYSLKPPILASDAPVDEFLFESKTGFCGHYASSFATLMRLSGVPSRIVVGFLGGELNPRSNQIVVRQSDAHAWVEIFQLERGWFRVDPTAAIAPERVDRSIDINSSLSGADRIIFTSADLQGIKKLLREIRWIKDAMHANWQRWFVHYDLSKQQQLLGRLGLGNVDKYVLTIFILISALAAITLLSLLLLWKERNKIDPLIKHYRIFCEKLKKSGIPIYHHDGPQNLCNRAQALRPEHATQIGSIFQKYIQLRYASTEKAEQSEIAEFGRLVKHFYQ